MGRQCREDVGRGARLLAVCAIFLVVSACTALYRDHGYTPSPTQLQDIRVGVDTRETVAEAIGTPSTMGVINESGFYYVSQRMRSYTWHEPEIVDRQIVAISFNSGGTVKNIERFGLEDGNVVALSRRVTSSSVEGVGFLSQLMGNVGRLDLGSNL